MHKKWRGFGHQIDSHRMKLLRSAWAAGLSIRTAAIQCEVDPKTANRYFRIWGTFEHEGKLTCFIHGETKRILIEEAARRETNLRDLVSEVVEAVAEDNLFQAVMEHD